MLQKCEEKCDSAYKSEEFKGQVMKCGDLAAMHRRLLPLCCQLHFVREQRILEHETLFGEYDDSLSLNIQEICCESGRFKNSDKALKELGILDMFPILSNTPETTVGEGVWSQYFKYLTEMTNAVKMCEAIAANIVQHMSEPSRCSRFRYIGYQLVLLNHSLKIVAPSLCPQIASHFASIKPVYHTRVILSEEMQWLLEFVGEVESSLFALAKSDAKRMELSECLPALVLPSPAAAPPPPPLQSEPFLEEEPTPAYVPPSSFAEPDKCSCSFASSSASSVGLSSSSQLSSQLSSHFLFPTANPHTTIAIPVPLHPASTATLTKTLWDVSEVILTEEEKKKMFQTRKKHIHIDLFASLKKKKKKASEEKKDRNKQGNEKEGKKGAGDEKEEEEEEGKDETSKWEEDDEDKESDFLNPYLLICSAVRRAVGIE
ncbi:uncharacterized protein MONOS_9668 [Monocercomonoides exilis]|uniref:uncharacterized protein n=1 Tax=Monocercomonoides exilis TaxID=2049356 RepID=UPI003559DDCD|nr:hypothetical protein MONOS_9668 [Monocercomonoides exilis]